jgi:hypothetical protein
LVSPQYIRPLSFSSHLTPNSNPNPIPSTQVEYRTASWDATLAHLDTRDAADIVAKADRKAIKNKFAVRVIGECGVFLFVFLLSDNKFLRCAYADALGIWRIPFRSFQCTSMTHALLLSS